MSLEKQIEFVRGARHLVYKKKRQVVLGKLQYDLLLAIEQTLMSAKCKKK